VDLSADTGGVTLLLGLVMVVGLFGVLVPVLPGTLLILAAGLAWALLVVESGSTRWVVVAVMAVLLALGIALKYALPGRRLSGQLPRRSLLLGAVAALVGLVLLPPFGLLAGGVLGIFTGELLRLRDAVAAGRSTVLVLKAVGLGVLAELTAGVAMVAVWLVGVLVT